MGKKWDFEISFRCGFVSNMVPSFFLFPFGFVLFLYSILFGAWRGGFFFDWGSPHFFFFLPPFISINPLRLLNFGSSAVGSDRELVMGIRICGLFFGTIYRIVGGFKFGLLSHTEVAPKFTVVEASGYVFSSYQQSCRSCSKCGSGASPITIARGGAITIKLPVAAMIRRNGNHPVGKFYINLSSLPSCKSTAQYRIRK
ncbi:hypothetical protein B9Z19DRAFT_413112 [Tuber borchii]|uniref:Uncharacterized protein n=1 Tax=Tuber borchii TaxID=42251 RepID=A0A2T6ZH22_TUBBO|nr:hypothetical protein B9Z19DRAFT_413112 [Tuber borchii]